MVGIINRSCNLKLSKICAKKKCGSMKKLKCGLGREKAIFI